METKRKVPEVVIRRLPRYYRYLSELDRNGKTRISSTALSEKMGVTASQIRQDFNYFGGFGQQGYGYNVKYLLNEIEELFGTSNGYKAIIVGAGHLGHALANYGAMKRRGFDIMGMFDVDPEKIGKDCNGIKIMDMKNIESFIRENEIDIAVLTLPKTVIEDVADDLVEYGIKGLWNFAYVELKTKKPVPVENVHLTDSLMTLAFKINQKIEE
ncbi:MAG: redox-sensing transcriptional repressor Rex [Clostridia bacterium]|nr:redox-sensing transcriptional repressor Rex [Clostridia bacterium]